MLTELRIRNFAVIEEAALSFAGGEDPFEAATEAIYEAAATVDDKRELVAIIESMLK